jgi:mRNA interferase MazF
MASYRFGDIVLLPFSYTDLKSEKRRPALVLVDADDGDILVARITSKNGNTNYDVALGAWNEVGLLIPSYVRIHKLLSVEKTHVIKHLGNLREDDKASVKKLFAGMLG